MAVYVFNILVDYMPNGIDNAQGYREKIFNQIGIDGYYVFTNFPKMRNISLYNNVGRPVNKMVNPILKMTGRDYFDFDAETDVMVLELEKNLNTDKIVHIENAVQLWKNGCIVAEIHTVPNDPSHFYEVYYFKNNCLIKADFYSNGRVYSDFFITASRDNGSLYAKKVKRVFYKKNGEVCLEQIDNNYIMNNGKIIDCYEIIDLYLDLLNLNENDSIIMDRAYNLEFNDIIFGKKLPCKKICVIHSGHYFEPNQSMYALYLSYEYYYWFKYSKYIDSFVVSTESQKKDLMCVLNKYDYSIPNIEVIPVGAIDNLRVSNDRKQNSILTASRIVRGKRIDLIVRAVIEAHKKNSNISLDIYGKGDVSVQNELVEIIQKNDASEYIHFMGFQCLDEVYKKYQLYISTSIFETFGLTLLEAASSGCALIGLDVPYGNTTFIENEKNGYLVEYNFNRDINYENQLINVIADRIVDAFSDYRRLNEFSEHSYKIANEFLVTKISEKWKRILEK